ncbi:MAG: FtsW/RodA/SpoVE family cell cycle protein [Actinomycetota bacterium]|nr:FtsW/RodA/SpoVE family cell cycle protein [Actinomycetota bacterium]
MILIVTIIFILAYLLAFFGRFPNAKSVPILVPILMALTPFAIHLTNVAFAPNSDSAFMPIVALLNDLGYVMIWRLNPHEASLQVLWTYVGVVLYALTLFFVDRSAILERFRFLFALAGLAMLVLPLVPGIGETINGARLWIHLGPYTFQPVEISKLLLAIFFASYFVEKNDIIGGAKGRQTLRDTLNPRILGPLLTAWLGSILIMLMERDVGFSLMLFLVFIITIWLTTARVRYLVGGILLFVGGALLATHLFGQVNERLITWIDPWKYAQTIGYQIVQAQYALAAGGVSGTGLGLGHPNLIPVVSSDFIFAAVGEELGLAGTSAMVIAFVLLVGVGLRTALRARNDFTALVATIFTTMLGLQAFFIMGGVVRLIPLTGVTLPFVAYGGSSLVSSYILVAVIMRISDEGSVDEFFVKANRLRFRRHSLIEAQSRP